MQANLLQLSRQGNADAIAVLMNRHLQPKGIIARVLLQDRCLRVMLDAIEAPDQQTLAPFVFKGILNLKIPSVQTIQVYGRKRGEKTPVWTQTFNPELANSASSVPSLVASTVQATHFASISQAQEPQPVALAKQDEQTDLATRLNQFINDEAITIRVEQQGTLLKVIAETDKFLEGPSFAKGIYQELLRFNVEKIETVEVYKQKLKGSHSFRIQSFALVKEEASAGSEHSATTIAKTEKPENQPLKTARSPQASSAQASTLQNTRTAQKTVVKKKENINGIRRKLTLAFTAIVAAFIIIRLISRLAWAFSSPMGYFSVVIALISIWRAWSFLDPLLQNFLRDE